MTKPKLTSKLTIAALTLFSAGPLLTASPYTQANNSWIELDGRVTSVDTRSFILDYGKGTIRVEIDDYDWFEEAYNVLENDRVKVRGKVDADPNQERSIEAETVRLKDHGVTLQANADDEEDLTENFVPPLPVQTASVEIRGTVESFQNGIMLVKTEDGMHRVDLKKSSLYSTQGKKISHTLRTGDFISVVGKEDKKLLGADEIDASATYVLKKITE